MHPRGGLRSPRAGVVTFRLKPWPRSKQRVMPWIAKTAKIALPSPDSISV
jgi:hypothetical protein